MLCTAASQSTPLVVQLSPAIEGAEKDAITSGNDGDKSTSIQPPSPVCVIIDEDFSPPPSIDKKIVRQTSEKKSTEPEKTSSKSMKRSRDSDRVQTKENSTDHSDSKRKRLNDGNSHFSDPTNRIEHSSRSETSKKPTSSSQSSTDKRSSNNR